MDFKDYSISDLEFELTLDRTKNDESRIKLIKEEIQNRKIRSLENELKREKRNTPLVKIFNYTLGILLVAFLAILVKVSVNINPTSGFSPDADNIAEQILVNIPLGNINNIKALFEPDRWNEINNQNTRSVFLAYQALGKHISNTNPVQVKLETITGAPFEALATYQSMAKFTAGDVELIFQIAKYSESNYKLFAIQVNSPAFREILHDKSLKL